MTSVSPPTYYFDGITFNSAFYTASSSGGLTEAQANALYLKKNTADTATALETFSGGIATNDIQSTTTSTDMSIGSSQTSGVLNIGCNGNEAVNGRTTGAINIGTDLNATGIIKIGNQSTITPVQIRGSLTVSRSFIASAQATCSSTLGVNGLLTASGGLTATGANIATGGSSSATINILNGNTSSGSVNIATGTGATQSTTVNIGSGTTTGVVTIGGTSNSILLNAPVTVKSTKESITYLTGSINTLTVANILASNLFGSTYSSANTSTENNSIGVTMPTPTSAMEGMTLVFRKLRGVFNLSSSNWLFDCTTSSFVASSLTSTATPTGTAFSTNSTVARFVVMGYSGSYYYFPI